MVNQTNQVQLVGHGGELSADGMQGEKETAVVHDRNFAVETNRRTMNFQRTANCVLTVCLSPGGRFNPPTSLPGACGGGSGCRRPGSRSQTRRLSASIATPPVRLRDPEQG